MWRNKLARTLALSLAAAAALVLTPPFSAPASAGAVMTGFIEGDVIKIKTTWGGGYVLNIGGTSGSFEPGVRTKIHWNSSWDNQNRFQVWGPWGEDGLTWHMMMNRWSGLCLAVDRTDHTANVIQDHCNIWDNKQWWAGQWNGTVAKLRNLDHHRAGFSNVLRQDTFNQVVGAPVFIGPVVTTATFRQEWIVHSCLFNGAEQKDC